MGRSVQTTRVGGITPRKIEFFNATSPPSNISRASPEKKGAVRSSGLSSSTKINVDERTKDSSNEEGRPKTSRNIPNPSPDIYASYVIPSPKKTRENEDPVWIWSPEEDCRPKTSRQVPKPSPDTFADYVIPSPKKSDQTHIWSVEHGVFEDPADADVSPSPPPPTPEIEENCLDPSEFPAMDCTRDIEKLPLAELGCYFLAIALAF